MFASEDFMPRVVPTFCPRFRRFLFVAVAMWVVGTLCPSTVRAENRTVGVSETPVRSAPFDVAPEVARLHAGDRVSADDQSEGPWRRVGLPDGRYGFVWDADTHHVGGPAIAPPPSKVTVPLSFQRPESSTAPEKPFLLGVMFELLPVGTLAAKPANGAGASADSVFAVGVAPFLDAAISPYLAVGISPQVIFRVKSDRDAGESAKEVDIRARFTGRLPLSPKVGVFGRFSPGYSTILLPSATGTSTVSGSNLQGFVMDFAAGLEVAVLPNLFIVSGLGYQAGFQSDSANELHTNYLHVGAGFAIGL